MITIYSPQGSAICSVNFNVGAKGYYSLMQHDYIVLPFSLLSPVDFPLGSYVNLEGVFDDALGGKLSKKYYVTSLQDPAYNTETGGYDYELRLDAYYWLWNNYIFKYLPETPGSEASWSLTAALDVHLGVFLRNLTALGFTYNGTPFTYSIDDTVENKAVTMTYDNVHLLDALFSLGGKDCFDCDVWITESVIHFGRCELGSAVKIEQDVEAVSIIRNDSKGTFATRVYAFGSTRNIPVNYRPVSEQAVINGVVQKRLMLPEGTPYVDAYENMPDTGVVETIVVFDNVYPRRVGTLQNVTSRTETVENDDGTESTYTYYRYQDTGLAFKDEYILEGENLQIEFQSGKLNGMKFGVIFEPDGTEKGSQVWEIVGNEDYGRFLPDDVIKPENGDKYVLSGFNIQLVSDQYIPEAEQELLEKTKEYVKKTMVDDGTYTVPLRSTWVRADELHRTFDVGQKVNLVSPAYFPNGRQSRVIGWEMNLDYPWDTPVYTVGESAQYSRLADIEDKVETLTYKGQTYTGGSGGGIYVIRTNDATPASDSNVFSALRSLATFLRKDAPDQTNYLLKLLGGLEVGKDGFASGMSGFGARIDEGGNGEVESLVVRRFLEVPELRYNRVDISVGDKWRAPGGGIIGSVDTEARTVTLKLEDGEMGAVAAGDLCMGIYHAERGNALYDYDDGRGNRRFAGFTTVYFKVAAVSGAHNETFSYELRRESDDTWEADAEPMAMMRFVAYGNDRDTDRQTSVYETRTYTRMLWKQSTWEFSKENVAMQYGDLGNLSAFGMDMRGYSMYLNNVYFTGTVTQVNGEGDEIHTANDRGEWQEGVDYAWYDRVSHGGKIWLCVSEGGAEGEPSEDNPDWLLQVDSGADGAPGKDGRGWTYLGEWVDGMHVPYLGVVRQGGAAYLCVVEQGTDRPPLYTLTDKQGARLVAQGWGYLLTGEANPEYMMVVMDGLKGDKGDKGDKGGAGQKGDKGEQGLQGCVLRVSEWAEGVKYRNDEAATSGTRYIDVALVRSGAATGWTAYKCLVTHTSSAATAPPFEECWQEFGVDTTAIFTSLIIAENAKITFMQGNQLLIQREDGTVTAGLSGSVDGGAVRIWAGSDTPGGAPFRVDELGRLTATDADINGTVTATAGKIAGLAIEGNALSNEGLDNNAYIMLRNDTAGKMAGVGSLSEAVGNNAVARFAVTKQGGLADHNTAMTLEASGAAYNHAILGTGNASLRGFAVGYALNAVTVPASSVMAVDLSRGNHVAATPAQGGGYLAPPTLTNARASLGIGPATPFAVPMTVINTSASNRLQVCGRARVTGAPGDYAILRRGSTEERQDVWLDPGDAARLILIYDGTEYYAYFTSILLE